jgi:hypothetical protein
MKDRSKFLAIQVLSCLILCFFVGASKASAQKCYKYHEDYCDIPDFSYYYNGQSKSGLFSRGQSSQLKIVVFEGEDYFISVCSDKSFGALRFKIMEDNEAKNVLYDNTKDHLRQKVMFTNDRARKLIIEVAVTKGSVKPGEDPNEQKCVGVLVAFRKSNKAEEIKDKVGF